MSRIRLSAEAEWQLRRQAQNRCGYCLSPQHLVFSPLEIEHVPVRPVGRRDVQAGIQALEFFASR